MSVDENDGVGHNAPCDSTPTMGTAMMNPAALVPDDRQMLEFDSPDSGLPSSRNYSVASGHSQILSSMEEELGDEGTFRAGHGGQSQRHTPTEDKLLTGSANIVPSFSSYTVPSSALFTQTVLGTSN